MPKAIPSRNEVSEHRAYLLTITRALDISRSCVAGGTIESSANDEGGSLPPRYFSLSSHSARESARSASVVASHQGRKARSVDALTCASATDLRAAAT